LFVVVVLQRPAHAVTLSGVQHVVPLHTSDEELQLAVPAVPQGTCWPQLLTAVPHEAPAHAVARSSGTQPQAPLTHAAPPSHSGHVAD
jgi:hypothetical protein